MDFFNICKSNGLSRVDTNKFHKHLMNKYPYGEHATLAPCEIEEELETWRSDRFWEKEYQDAVADYWSSTPLSLR